METRIFFAALLILTSCGSAPAPQGPGIINNEPQYSVALPFIESVDVPQGIREGQAFTVRVNVSAIRQPNVLRAENHSGSGPAPTVKEGVMGFKIFTWLMPNMDTDEWGTIVKHYDFELPGLLAGEHRLWLDTAINREDGGMEVLVQYSPTTMLVTTEGTKKLVIDFTVLQ